MGDVEGFAARCGRRLFLGQLLAVGAVAPVGLDLGESGFDVVAHLVADLGRNRFEQCLTPLAGWLGQDHGSVLAGLTGDAGG